MMYFILNRVVGYCSYCSLSFFDGASMACVYSDAHIEDSLCSLCRTGPLAPSWVTNLVKLNFLCICIVAIDLIYITTLFGVCSLHTKF